MTSTSLFPHAADVSPADYCVFGLATCFLREDGEVREVQILEPIPSAALEALLKGIPTSYKFACAKSLGEFYADFKHQMPAEFPPEAQFCDNFDERAIAACRTYKSRNEAKGHIPLGSKRNDLNFSLDRKRVLNTVNVVSAEDNVKQHSHTHKVL
jgi:hypothetical protein